MQGKRIERIGELVRNELSRAILERVRDPRIGFVTVTHADVSADLHHARVYYSVLGDERRRSETQEALESARGFLQRDLAQNLNLRYTPHLDFYFDDGVSRSIEIDGIVKDIEGEKEKEA